MESCVVQAESALATHEQIHSVSALVHILGSGARKAAYVPNALQAMTMTKEHVTEEGTIMKIQVITRSSTRLFLNGDSQPIQNFQLLVNYTPRKRRHNPHA